MAKTDFVGVQLRDDTDGKFLFVNPEHVMAFGDDGTGQCWLVFPTGERLAVKHSTDELLELFKR